MISASHSVSPHDRIAFDQLGTFSSLFTDYTQYSSRISPFFSGDYRTISAFEKQVQNTLNIKRDREQLANILLEQNTQWGLDDAVAKNIELIRDDTSVVVITGQQLGLFLSPLFIPYKTLTTIRLAADLQTSLQRPVVPVFWLHGEDHDFAETAPFTLINDQHNLIHHRYQPTELFNGPVGRMRFDQEINQLLDTVALHLPASPNKQVLLNFLRTQFTPGTSLIDAFALLLKRIFRNTGLVLFSVDDARIKHSCKKLFLNEIQEPLKISQAVEKASIKLAKSYHTQVQTNPINLFLMDDTHRRAINLQGQTFNIKDQPAPVTAEKLVDTLYTHPEKFSPNVILRPIVQDFIFPSIAYIAGPGEIAYFAQCKGAYDAVGIPMPLIYPRASITLIEPAVARVLEQYPHAFPAYNQDPNKLFRNYALSQLSIDLDRAVNDSLQQIKQAMHLLRDTAAYVHPSLYTTAESTKTRFERDILKFKEQIIRAQKRNEASHQIHFNKATTHLFPNQKLQERVLSPLHFLNAYGLDFFTSLMKTVSLDTTEHQIIRL